MFKLNGREQLATTEPLQPVKPAESLPQFRPPPRHWTARGNILFAFAVAIALALAWELRDVLLLVYVSALFAVVLMPVVNGIVRFEMRGGRRVSRGLAITILIGSAILLITVLLAIGLPPVISDIRQFAKDLTQRLPEMV